MGSPRQEPAIEALREEENGRPDQAVRISQLAIGTVEGPPVALESVRKYDTGDEEKHSRPSDIYTS